MSPKKQAPLSLSWEEKRVKVSDLVPYERNPRFISKKQFSVLVESLRTNGYHQRIIAQPDLTVIGGHQRIRALEELGVEEIVVLVPNRELSQAEFRQILVQDNLSFGEFDFDILSADFDRDELQQWGMSDQLLDNVAELSESGNTDADDVPALQDKVISKEGDFWLLGDHRLACGDSTNAALVERLMGLCASSPILMVTDPPYGVNYDPNWRNKSLRKNGEPIGARAIGEVLNDDRADWREAWSLFGGNLAYVWHGGLHTPEVAESLISCGFKIRAQIVWVKTRHALSRGHYHWQHEPALYAQKPDTEDNWRFGDDHQVGTYTVRNGSSGQWKGGRKQTTVWFIDHIKNETGHSTQKPVMCMQRPIENHTSKADYIYDPFLGSGTTLIAAQRTGRNCVGIELNPAYVDVIIRRWQEFTGRKAIHEASGKSFDVLATDAA